MTRPILILGAGVYQVPLIQAAQRRALSTVVVSRPGPYPGCALADVFLPLDITNTEGCLAAAREHNVQAVVTAGADAGLPTLGRIVDELGLPGPGLQAAYLSADKRQMKQAFTQAGVPTARHDVFDDAPAALKFAKNLGYPVMVKPPDSSGSRGVIRVDSAPKFAAAWQEALTHSRSGQIIVERCLLGREYGAQAVVHGDQVTNVFIHDDTVTGPPLSTPVGHSMPTDLSAAMIARTEQVVRQAVAALGLRDCVANVDLMLVNDEPQIIELGGRMGATGIPEMIGLFTGCDMYDHVLDLALGQAGPLVITPGRANAVSLLCSDQTGTITSLEVPTTVSNHPDLVALQWDVEPGDKVRRFRVGSDRAGQLQVSGVTAADARNIASDLSRNIRIVTEEKA